MKIVFLACLFALLIPAAEPTPRNTVLAELFTSEGCSSCPSADALLMKLDKLQPVAGVQIIVLSEHVDYWNSLGWTDPFSSAQFTKRQEMFASLFREDSYTPQLVINGHTAFSGNSEKDILPALAKEAARPKTAVRITSAKREGNEAVININVEAGTKADVWVAIADDRDQTSVKRGENTGRTLNHVAVVRTLTKVGATTKTVAFEKEVRLPAQAAGQRVVVFVADAAGPVKGSAIQELP